MIIRDILNQNPLSNRKFQVRAVGDCLVENKGCLRVRGFLEKDFKWSTLASSATAIRQTCWSVDSSAEIYLE